MTYSMCSCAGSLYHHIVIKDENQFKQINELLSKLLYRFEANDMVLAKSK